MKARPGIYANVHIELRDAKSGALREERKIHNLVVLGGAAMYGARIVGTAQKAVDYMQIGRDGGTAAASTDTDINTSVDARVTCDTAALTANQTVVFKHTWTAGELSATGISEAGLFNQRTAAAGTMLARAVFVTVNKTSSDTLKITWEVRVVPG
ncbi:MAG: hypothetical protein JRE40_14310 [Deltaproteobacteria bacterium]|nr:hypothetical protein [Deltaproteobacteria bacterium]